MNPDNTNDCNLRWPFSLKGVGGIRPVGVYDVDMDEELIDDLSLLAYRRVATRIHLQKTVPAALRGCRRASIITEIE